MSGLPDQNTEPKTEQSESEGHHGTPEPARRASGQAGEPSTSFAAASQWFNKVSHKAWSMSKEYATVAGKQIDRAADAINDSIDHYAAQVRT